MSLLASLARAYDRMPELPRPSYSTEKIGFVIGLNPDGTIASVSDLRDGEGRKKTARMMQVPQGAKRTAAIVPNLLWDKTAYVLGVTAGEGRRTADEHAAFKARQTEVFGASDDEGLVAFLRFLDRWTPDQFVSPGWPEEMKDANVVFALESERLDRVYLHDRAAARQRLAQSAISAKGPQDGPVCLITGAPAPVARLHPAIKNIWGGQSSGGAIVSFNLEAFTSYGHEQGDNAQISEEAAFRYTTALNAMLAGRRNRVQVADASTVFWADASGFVAEAAEDAFGQMFNGVDEARQGDKVGQVLERVRAGIPFPEATAGLVPDLAHGVRFHVLGLAPNAARIAIRFWFEDDFGVLAENYRRYVEDLRVEPAGRDPYPPLWRYLNETAVLGKRENVQPNLAGEMMRAILTGGRYPMTLLSAVLTRIRADGEINALRVGLLRAVLRRNFNMEKEAPVALDPDNRNKGYLLGRLFALYEYAQTAALGRNVNATIKDKFYASASASPRRVFSLLERGSVNHLSKVGKQRPGQRVNLERAIGEIMGAMTPGEDPFPASLPAEDQALFGLGYYHQRNQQFVKQDSSAPGEGQP
ncbi:CRISPR-associated protein, Csd1 family [Devosia enhydra]|uniref:CRISPR-associated protein, Csd1 family n=1 Tax=Devosia enhydra TaxID=665118 RepID=A0A1K2I3T2_9HYPH|nr:type I-C CRISPR-associated protein Cas8c/Csd1 [Devosia enhydra]SFZ86883.1 CRISPR-associated protein, Csd1 family [Devosia enhydra]